MSVFPTLRPIACRRARLLITPYLDQRLTGEEMLSVRGHLDGCRACRREFDEAAEVKRLLRSMASRPAAPARMAEQRVYAALDHVELERGLLAVLGWHALAEPRRGRRLGFALVVSCVTVLTVAAPFAQQDFDVRTAQSLATPAPSANANPGLPTVDRFAGIHVEPSPSLTAYAAPRYRPMPDPGGSTVPVTMTGFGGGTLAGYQIASGFGGR